MKKAFIVVILVAVISLGVLALRQVLPLSGISNPQIKPEPSTGQTIPDVPMVATLSGEYTCLPHRDTTGPQTLECALGLKTAEGLYYSLDLQSLSPEVMNIPTGKIISVSGMLVPIEQISSSHWQKYNIEGIMKVESLE